MGPMQIHSLLRKQIISWTTQKDQEEYNYIISKSSDRHERLQPKQGDQIRPYCVKDQKSQRRAEQQVLDRRVKRSQMKRSQITKSKVQKITSKMSSLTLSQRPELEDKQLRHFIVCLIAFNLPTNKYLSLRYAFPFSYAHTCSV